MSEQTRACPICRYPYKVYMFYAADQSACPGCISKAKMVADKSEPTQQEAVDKLRKKWGAE